MHLKGKLEKHLRAEPLTPMYWNVFLRGLGVSMMGLFTPIFIFLIGQGEGGVVEGLRLVLIYLFLQRLGISILVLGVSKVVAKLGFRISLLLGSVLLVFYYLIPGVWGEQIWVVYLMASISAVAIPFYWLSRHSILSMDGKRRKRGVEIGLLTLIDKGSAMLSPVVGGVILGLFGFKVLFIVGAVIVLFSSVPPFFMDHHVKESEVGVKDFWSWVKDRKNISRVFSFVGDGWEGVVSAYFWPVYIFLIVGSFQILGGMTSAVLLFSSLMVFLAGRVFDKDRAKGGMEDEKRYWFVGGILAVLKVLRGAFGTLGGVFGLDLVTKLVSPYYWVPFASYIYSMGEKGKALSIYAYRSVIYSLGVMILTGILWWVMGQPWRWWGVFGINGVAVLLTFPMARES